MFELFVDLLFLEVGDHEFRADGPWLRAHGGIVSFVDLVVSCVLVVALYTG